MIYLQLGAGVVATIPVVREWRNYSKIPEAQWSGVVYHGCIARDEMEE